MTEIPEDVMKAAKHQCDACGITPYSDMRVHAEYVAAFAIMAERERAAKVADTARREYEKMADRAADDWGLQNIRDSEASVCGEIADAIRRGDA